MNDRIAFRQPCVMIHSRPVGTGLRGALPFSFTLLLVPLVIAMTLDKLPDFVPWVVPWVILPLIPYIKIVETLVKNDVPNLDRNTPESDVFWHMAILVCWGICYPLLVVFILWAVCNLPTLILYERIVLLVFCGMLGRLVTITSHDLSHRPKLWARRLAEFTMSSLAMPHWYTEHVYMHHPNVATPRDRESARVGQSYYHYFFTVLPSVYAEAFRVQFRRLARRGLSFWHRSNPVWLWIGMWVAWIALALAIGGWIGLAAWIFIVLFAAWGMRAVSYMQHYGLQRILQPNGRYEPIQPHHSWNHSSSSNYLYFSIQRHSDHHDKPRRPYPLLHGLSDEKAPSLPSNYGSMMTLILFPSLWFRKMNPLVEEWRRKFYPDIEDWRALSSAAYRHRPESLPLISEVIHGAPCLARYMEHCYPLIDSITNQRFQQITIPENVGMEPDELLFAQRGLLRLYYGHEFGYEEMIEDIELAQVDIADDIIDGAQLWCNDHAFQLGVRMMRGHVLAQEAGIPLSNMADVVISVLARTVLDEFVSYHGPIAGDGVAVVALGRLGERRMTLECEVDLMVLSDGASTAEEKKFVLEEHAGEFCKRFNKLAERMSANNLLVKSVNLRPPDGGVGNATGGLKRFADGRQNPDPDYLKEMASARIVCMSGDGVEEFARRFKEARRLILLRHATAEISPSPKPSFSDPEGQESLYTILKGPGGLADLEMLGLRLRLQHIEGHTDIVAADGTVRLLKELGDRGMLEPELSEALAEAGSFLLGLECALSLGQSEPMDDARLEDSVKATVARACDVASFEDVVARASAAASCIAEFPIAGQESSSGGDR